MQNIKILIIICLIITFAGCTQSVNEPIINSKIGTRLEKRDFSYSDNLSWPKEEIKPPVLGNQWNNYDRSVESWNYTFGEYNFTMHYSISSNAYITINNTTLVTFEWPDYPNATKGWTDWKTFTYNGVNMMAKIRLYDEEIINKTNTNLNTHFYEPTNVQIAIQNTIVAPDAPVLVQLGLTGSYSPKVVWNTSTDSDVDQVEIWRSGSLLATVPSTQSTYTDNTVDWNYGRTYTYKLRFKDGTHNLYSTYSNELSACPKLKAPANFIPNPAYYNLNDSNKVVTLNWSPSDQPVVTGYEIYKFNYTLVKSKNGDYAVASDWVLWKTISSRTTATCQDDSPWGSVIGKVYCIRAISTTYKLASDKTAPQTSLIREYDSIILM
jgi:hypothetical protein